MLDNKEKPSDNYNKPNFWGMIQNVLIASLNKGQFLGAFVGLIFLIMIIKLTPEDTNKLLLEIFEMFGNKYYIGWALGAISSFGWYISTKRLRRIHQKEIDRISQEKKTLQEKVTDKKLTSSKL